jgi:hypothetical protein
MTPAPKRLWATILLLQEAAELLSADDLAEQTTGQRVRVEAVVDDLQRLAHKMIRDEAEAETE